jgi:hypothetical protein
VGTAIPFLLTIFLFVRFLMNPMQYFGQQLVLLFVFCLIMPALGSLLLFKAFRVFGVPEIELPTCIKVFFAATGIAYLSMMTLGRLLLGATMERIWLSAAVVAAIELAVIAIMLRKFDTRALLIAAAVVVLVNVAGYGLIFQGALQPVPVQGGR